ncbi:peptidylprolyl isomerase [Chitinasiproducens palmae]|uniref:peptidylprolyl isomerase n=1 Tax=Chitinasiproducens palmae TaxID=1770053 RepID=A0A1H2PTR2_9BURK|nr:peptidylprolyl isomerase [Chitinasiproducens palmae]SDV50510.1 peptidyl-prolyl cis-trans isomerase C [Chitinasiproducens palmae]
MSCCNDATVSEFDAARGDTGRRRTTIPLHAVPALSEAPAPRDTGPAVRPLRVNGVEISTAELAAELQYHPAGDRETALQQASVALAIRELLRQRAHALGIDPPAPARAWQAHDLADEACQSVGAGAAGAAQDRHDAASAWHDGSESHAGESHEEARTRALLAREVALPDVEQRAVLRYYEANRDRFRTAPLLAVRHILLACAPADAAARSRARAQAVDLLGRLRDGAPFTALASAHSDCPSRQQGGALGQISKGQTVPEFERALFALPCGLCLHPIESRYGVHVVIVDERMEGRALPFEAVREAIRRQLAESVWRRAVSQYLAMLVGAAHIEGVAIDGATSPLLQ